MSNSHLDENGFVVIEPDEAEMLAAAEAIVECQFCDDDGLRNGFPCDHQDHAAAAARGMELIREALRKGNR